MARSPTGSCHPEGLQLHLPELDYLLYADPVGAATARHALGTGADANQRQLADRALCVATEIDVSWVYVDVSGRQPV